MVKNKKETGFFGKLWLRILRMMKMDLVEKRELAGYVFVLPFIIGLLAVFIPSIIQSFIFSRNEIIITPEGGGYTLVAKGFEYYHKAFFVDDKFRVYLLETFRDILINLPVILIFSFFMAVLLNRKKFPGRTVFRVIFFLPVIIYTGIAATAGTTSAIGEEAEIAAQVFASPTVGAGGSESMQSGITSIVGIAVNVQNILQSLSMGTWLMNFIMGSINRLEWIIQSSGVQIIVFLAALQSIPSSIFEAANVEGLTTWEMFWKITLPMVSPMILVNSVYTVVDSFTNPRYKVLPYIKQFMIDLSYQSALSFIYFICSVLVIGLIFLVISRYIFYNE